MLYMSNLGLRRGQKEELLSTMWIWPLGNAIASASTTHCRRGAVPVASRRILLRLQIWAARNLFLPSDLLEGHFCASDFFLFEESTFWGINWYLCASELEVYGELGFFFCEIL